MPYWLCPVIVYEIAIPPHPGNSLFEADYFCAHDGENLGHFGAEQDIQIRHDEIE
jgi:hypothetical protein